MEQSLLILQQWQDWNHQGFIPGPNESESEFIKRVQYCQNLSEHLFQEMGIELPFDKDDLASQDLLMEVLPNTEKLYGIAPQWVKLFFSNHKLAPWHGGCAWIFQLDEQSPTSSLLQLREGFRQSKNYLGLYHRNELITHELAHVGRMLYQEPQFEEFFAYQSSSGWRSWLGPIIQSSKESVFFILILGMIVLLEFSLLTVQSQFALQLAWWSELVPFVIIFFALGRLFYRHRILSKCLMNLKKVYPIHNQAKHFLYRLRDCEIKKFARLSSEEIKEFINKSAQNSFRWQFLKSIYSQIS